MDEYKFNDVSAYSSEKQPFIILSWACSIELFVRQTVSKGEALSEHDQQYLVKELSLANKFIIEKNIEVTKPLRDQLSRCYSCLYAYSSSKRGLFELANGWTDGLNASKPDKYSTQKHLSVACLAMMYESDGKNLVSIAAMVTSILLKHLHKSQHAGFRASVLRALTATTAAVGDSLEDASMKDMWKSLRSLVSDKSNLVVSRSLDLARGIVGARIMFNTSADFDNFVKHVFLKAADSTSCQVRISAANCLATICAQFLDIHTLSTEALLEASAVNKASVIDDASASSTAASAATTTAQLATGYNMNLDTILNLLKTMYLAGNSRNHMTIIHTFASFFRIVQPSVLERNYTAIAKVVLGFCASPLSDHSGGPGTLKRSNSKRGSSQNITSSALTMSSISHRMLLAQKESFYLLDTVIAARLGEIGQIDALKSLVSVFLGAVSFNSPGYELAAACLAVSGLVKRLGNAIASVPNIPDALVNLVSHPNVITSSHATATLIDVISADPTSLNRLLTSSLSLVSSDSASLASVSLPSELQALRTKILNRAGLVSQLVSLTTRYPQYVSLSSVTRVLTTSTSLLKNSSGTVENMCVLIETGWSLLTGLMTLGPEFVKVHLSQLFLLWKAALHKPLKELTKNIELAYYLHVRKCALLAMESFLLHNSKLVTLDVTRRLGLLLNHADQFINSIPQKKLEMEEVKLFGKYLGDYHLLAREALLRNIKYAAKFENGHDIPASIITSAVVTISDLSKYDPRLSSTIASSAGIYNSIWELSDNHAFGLTSMAKDIGTEQYGSQAIVETDEEQIQGLLTTPILTSIASAGVGHVPLYTSLVDLSITLFAQLFPTQTKKVQESLLGQLTLNLEEALADRKSLARNKAVAVNVMTVVFLSLSVIKDNSAYREKISSNSKLIDLFASIINKCIADEDSILRSIAAQSLGALCAIGGPSVSASQIKQLIDNIVKITEPASRSGASLSLGFVMKNVGAMYAGIHMKTVLQILISLANDPHPAVHTFALQALSTIILSTGLTFSPFVSSTVSSLSKLFVQESHGDEMAASASVNMDLDRPSSDAFARCIQALITVAGPDLQSSSDDRLIVNLHTFAHQFLFLRSHITQVHGLRSVQDLIIFAPKSVSLYTFAKHCQKLLENKDLRTIAIDGIYQLLKTYGPLLPGNVPLFDEKSLWLAYDSNYDEQELRKIFKTWLADTVLDETILWVNRCQTVLLKPKSFFTGSLETKKIVEDIGDEEAAQFAEKENEAMVSDEPLRWQTRALAIDLLRTLLRSSLHGLSLEKRSRNILITKAGEIVKSAFTAATSNVMELRILGLELLDEALAEFSNVRDRDLHDTSLLEQYQAQISSALTPAFEEKSTPELAVMALKVSAKFIGGGIVQSAERMGRILKVFISALESLSSSSSVVLGDLTVTSSNAQTMVTISVLSMWAELQVASKKQPYLVDVVKPYLKILIPKWIQLLKEFAKLRFEPEQSSTLNTTPSLDDMNVALSRTITLPIYQDCWLQVVDAIASVIDEQPETVFEVLANDSSTSGDPSSFFFVLFGLCFETLVRPPASEHNIDKIRVLTALTRILHPSVHNGKIYEEAVFAETIDLLDRIALIGTTNEQRIVVRIAYNLAVKHPERESLQKMDADKEDAAGEQMIDQLFELCRVAMLPLLNLLPNLAHGEVPMKSVDWRATETQALVREVFSSFVDMVNCFPDVVKDDLIACVLHVFSQILDNPECQETVVPTLLPSLKKLMITCGGRHERLGTLLQHTVSLLRKSSDVTTRKNCLFTSVVIVSAGASDLPLALDLCDELLQSISIPELSQVSAECIKALLSSTQKAYSGKEYAVRLIPSLISLAQGEEHRSLATLVVDIMVSYSNSLTDEKQQSVSLKITVPLLVWYTETYPDQAINVVGKFLELAKIGTPFKQVVQEMSESQKAVIARLLTAESQAEHSSMSRSANHIQLKSF